MASWSDNIHTLIGMTAITVDGTREEMRLKSVMIQDRRRDEAMDYSRHGDFQPLPADRPLSSSYSCGGDCIGISSICIYFRCDTTTLP